MQFLADENFPYPSVQALRAAGLDVEAVQEMVPGIADTGVMDLAQRLERTILTFDRDFGELVFKYGLQPMAGIVYFRAVNYLPAAPADWLLTLLAGDQSLSFRQKFTTLTPEMSRQREY